MTTASIEGIGFEDSYARLEQVVQRLEAGDLGLEESVRLYEEGMRLAEHCGQQLDSAELRVTQLLSSVAQPVEEDPFEEG